MQINVGETQINYSFGSIIALVILVLCVVLACIGTTINPTMLLVILGALALSRLC